MSEQQETLLKVANKSDVKAVAGAISKCLQNHEKVVLSAIGAGALAQAVKAVAIARSFVAAQGMDLAIVPAFATVMIPQAGSEDLERTAMRLMVRVY